MPKKRVIRKLEVRRKREFTLHGRTLPELQALPLDQLALVLGARARRTIRRGFSNTVENFHARLLEAPTVKPLRTHCRDALILPLHVGRRVAVYNGKEFKEFEVRPEMIGHYYGEFTLTRRFEKHSGPGVGATRSSKFMPLK
ncbi:MAG: 30S ribosomal protein S19 [Thermoplasmata archaeon]|nr:30S ribosomal protein S19 [Thermoplasmata archaeon]